MWLAPTFATSGKISSSLPVPYNAELNKYRSLNESAAAAIAPPAARQPIVRKNSRRFIQVLNP
jgi:hypothetical protein